jgi:hypothetical protein
MIEFIIEYWLTILFVGLMGGITGIWKHYSNKLHKRFCEHDIIKAGLLVIIRAELVKSYNYYMEKGYCPIYARDTINPMFREYIKLGGNGVIPDLMEELNNLPTDKKYCKEIIK